MFDDRFRSRIEDGHFVLRWVEPWPVGQLVRAEVLVGDLAFDFNPAAQGVGVDGVLYMRFRGRVVDGESDVEIARIALGVEGCQIERVRAIA